MEKIIIINKTNGFYSEVLNYKFKIEFETINFYLNENLNKSEKNIIKEINDLINQYKINYLVAEGDYLSLINYDFISKINCNKKILFLTDDYDMHEVNFISAKAFDFIFTACPISNYRYLEKGFDSYFVPLEANKFAKTEELLSSAKDNWKGPYTALPKVGLSAHSLGFQGDFWMV